MEQTETRDGAEKRIAVQSIWITLSAAQREQVLQILVRIGCQILVQAPAEVQHEPGPE